MSGVEAWFSICPACGSHAEAALQVSVCICRDLTVTFHVDISLLFDHIHLKFPMSSDLCKDSDGPSYTAEHIVSYTHPLYQQYKIIHTQHKFSIFFYTSV